MLRYFLAAVRLRDRDRIRLRFCRLGDVGVFGRRLRRREDGLGFDPVPSVLVVSAQTRIFLPFEAALLAGAEVRSTDSAGATAAAAALAESEFIFLGFSEVRRVVGGRGVELEHGRILQRTHEILGWHRWPGLLGLVAGSDA